MILLTLLYNETNEQRQQEYKFCFLKNLNNPGIKKIVVFYDTSLDNDDNTFHQWLKQHPINIVPVDDRITYFEAFNHANQWYKDHTIILANGDIYFDDTLSILTQINLTNTFLSITRDDLRGSKGEGSSDVWVFKSPILGFGEGLQMGTTFCDQIISFLAIKNGMKVYNPCHSINCYHHHISYIRNMPGTHMHNPKTSSTKDNLNGMSWGDLKEELQSKYDIQLMRGLSEGGGMISGCRLVRRNI